MKRIPKAFQMGPHRIEVLVVDRATITRIASTNGIDFPVLGLCVYSDNKIYVQKIRPGFSKTQQIHTFWHEYFHMLFEKVGRPRLSRDEGLVDVCGGIHLQAINTWE